MFAARSHSRFVTRLVAYADQSGTPDDSVEFVIPEDLASLSDEALAALHQQAVSHFDALFNDGQGLTSDQLDALAVLTEGIETLAAESATRQTAAGERAQAAAALAARAHPETLSSEGGDGGDGADETDEADGEDADAEVNEGDNGGADGASDDGSAAAVVASAPRGAIRVSLPGLRSRQSGNLPRPAHAARTMKDIVLASGEGNGYAPGTGLDWNDVGQIVDRRLTSFNLSQYQMAARSGQHLRQQFGIATVRKPYDPELVISSNDPSHVDDIMQRATRESRLPGGSLVAAGGWCAPSENIYDLCELESRDGLFSLPEVGVTRGGINYTTGPNFADMYANSGFSASEADAIAGKWAKGATPTDPNVVGDKDCYAVPCPDFEDSRLNVAGVCITANLLMQRGYPEMIARWVRGSLVAHDHKMSAKLIQAVVAGSDAVTMTADQVGATAPILDAIELQVEHMRAINRIARGRSFEAVFPFWVRGAIRSDLSRRLGVDLLNVSDAQIGAWFSARGVSPQFVYNWQDPSGTAAAWTAWPATVQFLLYPSGTWVRGGGDMITLDTLFDSTLLATNEFTALFTEEAWLAAKMCHDSRVITVALCPNGGTHGGSDIACDGTAVTTP